MKRTDSDTQRPRIIAEAARTGSPKSGASKLSSALLRIRSICLVLPSVEEKLSHGAPSFHVRNKMLLMFHDNHHGDGRLAVWCKAPPGAQASLVESDDLRFFVPPYVGAQGWVGVRLDQTKTPFATIAALVEEAWRMVAPKRLLAAVDANRG